MRLRRFFTFGTGLVPALFLLVVAACSGGATFQGTVLERDPAPEFRLTDQFGDTVDLSEMAGKVVVLAFLYTSCPDVCPIVTSNLHRTHLLLADLAGEVQFLAISVDPQRDSVERAHRYSQEMDMLERWRFLVGSEEKLAPIWRAYWLDPVVGEKASHDDSVEDEGGHLEGTGAVVERSGDGLASSEEEGDYLVSHSASVFLIDREGYRRVLFTNLSLYSEALASDIRLLVDEGP